jgi:hypothetical protein
MFSGSVRPPPLFRAKLAEIGKWPHCVRLEVENRQVSDRLDTALPARKGQLAQGVAGFTDCGRKRPGFSDCLKHISCIIVPDKERVASIGIGADEGLALSAGQIDECRERSTKIKV